MKKPNSISSDAVFESLHRIETGDCLTQVLEYINSGFDKVWNVSLAIL